MLLNSATGETIIDGTDYHVVFTLEMIAMVENALNGKSPMELIETSRTGRTSLKETQVLVWAGMEGYRRRRGAMGGQVNPAKALKVIEEGGGLYKVGPQVLNAFMLCPALGLGLNPEPDEPGAESLDPTTGADSFGASAPQEFGSPTPGT